MEYKYSTLDSRTNVADGTYNSYFDPQAYDCISIYLTLTGTLTVKIYGSPTRYQSSNSHMSGTYEDITSIFGVASITATDNLIDDAGKLRGYGTIKVEVVAAGGGTDDFTVAIKRAFS